MDDYTKLDMLNLVKINKNIILNINNICWIREYNNSYELCAKKSGCGSSEVHVVHHTDPFFNKLKEMFQAK